jgi:hypothetical protein
VELRKKNDYQPKLSIKKEVIAHIIGRRAKQKQKPSAQARKGQAINEQLT